MSITSEKSGFTLIELLVVIVIITLLIAILLPSLQKVRIAAQRTQCLASVRQNCLGMINYTQENRFRLPDFTSSFASVAAWNNSTVAWNMTFRENLGPYVGVTQFNPYGFKPGATACPVNIQIYYYNAYILGYDQFNVWSNPIPLDRIARPTEVYWVGDYLYGNTEFFGHHGHRIAGFVDGHAKSFDEATLFQDLLGGDFFNTKAHPY